MLQTRPGEGESPVPATAGDDGASGTPGGQTAAAPGAVSAAEGL